MKQFIVFVRKEFYHVFRDPKTMLLLFGMPIVQIFLFGFALTNEISNAKIIICDLAQDRGSHQLIQKIDANKSFEVDHIIHQNSGIEAAFQSGDIKLAIVFPNHFDKDFLHLGRSDVQIIADATDPNTATALTAYASRIIMDYQVEQSIEMKRVAHIVSEIRMVYNPELKGVTNFVPGVMSLVLLLVCVLMTSVSIVKEKETGTMEVLLVSPFNPILVILSKAVPYFILSLINLTLILVPSIIVLGMPMKGSYLLVYAESALFIFTALGLGLLISNSTNSQQAAMLISLMAMLLPTIMLTGFMFPVENMPVALQFVSYIVPSKYYYIIVKSIMIKGLGLAAIWKETLVLALMCLALLAFSIKKFKRRLE